jgi:hypothetical protein
MAGLYCGDGELLQGEGIFDKANKTVSFCGKTVQFIYFFSGRWVK